MSIRRFFAGHAFEPEAITKMSVALETVCSELGLQVIDDTVTRLVAQKIIELTERGVKNQENLCALAVQVLTGQE
jgi:hypothetical protein